MKWNHKGYEFHEISKKIKDKNIKMFLWGASNIGKKFMTLYSHELNIVKIVDSDTKKYNQTINGLNIQNSSELKLQENSIVIVTCSNYDEIRPILEKKGYKNLNNLFYYEDFIKIFELYEHGRLISNRLDISLTEKCSLKCIKCNMFMPYFKNPKNQKLEDVKKDVDLYFDLVDHVKILNLLGGEPLLYPDLEEVINYIGKRYGSRIERIIIFTNGTIIPKENIIKAIKENNITVQFSDYTKVVDYKEKIEKSINILNEEGIDNYKLVSDNWGDFGFPDNPNNIQDEEKLIDFFDRCRAPFRGIWDKKVYFCHLETSAIRAEIFNDNDNDSFSLSNLSNTAKKEFLEFDFGYNELGYINFCKVCRGCDCVNDLIVTSSVQAGSDFK